MPACDFVLYFEEKGQMKASVFPYVLNRLKAVQTVFLLTLQVSCGIVEIGTGRGHDNNVWVPKVPEDDSGGHLMHSVCYMTAVEYPKGYDWLSDVDKGVVKCSLAVYADGSPRLKVAVGDAFCISSDPDMHRIIDGQLYTDYSTDTETIVKRNGMEIFRYGARESVCGMYVDGNDVYTLGQSRSGTGFSFRKNGETVVARRYGQVFRHLDAYGEGGLSFAFFESVSSATGGFERYYLVKDSIVTQVAVRDDIKKVWDVVIHKGEPCYVASVSGYSGLMLAEGERLSALSFPSGAAAQTCRMFVSGESLCVEAVVAVGGKAFSIVWKDGREVCRFDSDMAMSAMYVDDGGVNCVLNSSSRYGNGLIYRDGEMYGMPEGYYSIGGSTVASVNGLLYVGLSSSSCEAPVLWKEGEEEKLAFNGFISSVTSVAVVP